MQEAGGRAALLCSATPSTRRACLPRVPQEWESKWNGKQLRLKNPDSGETLEVTVRAPSGCAPRRCRHPVAVAALSPAGCCGAATRLPPARPQVIDTCDDSDCGGCCTRNASLHGGMLIDLEWHTAKRFVSLALWGPGARAGLHCSGCTLLPRRRHAAAPAVTRAHHASPCPWLQWGGNPPGLAAIEWQEI